MMRRFGLALLLLVLLAPLARAQDEAPDYEALAATYEYDADLPLEVETAEEIVADGQLRRIEFSSHHDERVPAVVGLPSSTQFGEGPYPAIVFGHGLGGSKDDATYRLVAQLLVANGYALIMIDYPLHGERQPAELETLMADLDAITPEQAAQWIQAIGEAAVQTVLDQRRAVDYLCTLEQVDPERIGYVGLSLGAILGSVLSAVDDRLACSALVVGGADWKLLLENTQIARFGDAVAAGQLDIEALAGKMAVSDPKYFAPHIQCPLLLLFGGKDTIVPYEICGTLLAELAPEPKTIHVFENSGHLLEAPGDQFAALRMLQQWLGERLAEER